MLYKFKSRAAADLILLEPHARRLLQIIGKEATTSGIITAAQIPAAIAALEAAVNLDEQQYAKARAEHRPIHNIDEDDLDRDEDDRREKVVRLHQRAAPFIEMLRYSVAENCDVIWGR